ncbi:MAG: dTDP-4-amino-4,6-dideoxygalactose transaminase [Flavobacteriales bacterium]
MIRFNKPYQTGRELEYIRDALERGRLAGNGHYTQKCHAFFEERYGLPKVLLTTNGTHAMEMSSILMGIREGDEVIMPSFTFVSTANAFVLRGAKLVFADSRPGHPNMDLEGVEKLITKRTKAIVLVHYGGMACDMDRALELTEKHNLFLVEDAAHAIEATYKGEPLGSFGQFATFSFHETKNVVSGEGGMIAINVPRQVERAEIVWEKGTNRAAFFRGEVDQYDWIDVGSSYLPSEVNAAFLYAQLEAVDRIQTERRELWDHYWEGLKELEEAGRLELPRLPEHANNNAHLFYLITRSLEERTALIEHLKEEGIKAVFHYRSLHKSPFYKEWHDGRELPNADRFSDRLVRLPFFIELSEEERDHILDRVKAFYGT